MRVPVIIAAVCVFASFAGAQVPTDTCSLVVHVTGLRNDKGLVEAALYNSEETFPGDSTNVFRAVAGRASNGESTVAFTGVPRGTYAIAVLHDENMNKKMDKGMFGIPKEGYGFSNDASGIMGPPSFDRAKFVCDRDTLTVTIMVRY